MLLQCYPLTLTNTDLHSLLFISRYYVLIVFRILGIVLDFGDTIVNMKLKKYLFSWSYILVYKYKTSYFAHYRKTTGQICVTGILDKSEL